MSLKCLSIIDVCYLRHVVRIRICSPGLISLQLDDFEGLTPCLENMPLLETAYVGLGDGCYDFCRDGQGDCSNPFCGCHFYPVNNGVLLGGFSNVVKLELIALPRMVFLHTLVFTLGVNLPPLVVSLVISIVRPTYEQLVISITIVWYFYLYQKLLTKK